MRRRLMALLALAACGAAGAPPPIQPIGPLDPPPPAPVVAPPPPPPRRPAGLTRSALTSTLDAGPGRFLARVSVRAAYASGRFVGWEIESLWPGADIGLVPGDVVVTVNGRSLERPESLPALFEELRRATEVVVEYRRGLERREARFPVEEDAGNVKP